MDQVQDSLLAECGAKSIFAAFETYQAAFTRVTRRARSRFEQQDWLGIQRDAGERLDLYAGAVSGIAGEIGQVILAGRCKDREIWAAMRAAYARLVNPRDDLELAETFFNSVSRRIFTTVGVNTRIEFVDTDFEYFPLEHRLEIYTCHPGGGALTRTVADILQYFAFAYEDLERDTRQAAAEIQKELASTRGDAGWDGIEMLNTVFYRSKGAYLVGRICRDGLVQPLVFALLNHAGRIYVDAVLLTIDEVSIVFSYTRSYFHVDVEVPHELVRFLHTILPNKRIAEIYISIGYNKHGKTELYRDLRRHLSSSSDRFDIAPGEKGMVMLVFTMPSYDMVFKIIKDHFSEPKTTNRQDVLNSYQLVFKHDRAGRLIDAQEYEYLEFDLLRFTPELLHELQTHAAHSIQIVDGQLIIKHLYTERRMTPLDVYVRTAPQPAVNEAAVDYGQAIKDLAATNIFPGDILLKNFGVTRHGRVVFYDYDELTLLANCQFRKFPPPRSESDYMDAEPWFYVGVHDIFPEEFETFLGLLEPYRKVFKEAHADLFGVDFWRTMQKRHKAGEVIDIFPYKQSKRLLGDR